MKAAGRRGDFMVQDLTVGKPLKVIFFYTIPIVLGLWLQQIYSMVDTAIVGRTLGAMALGGVGSTSSLNFFILGFCNGLCAGMALPVAQYFGAGKHAKLRHCITNSVWLAVIVSAVILAVFLPLCRSILTVMKTPEEQFDYAFVYIFIIIAGTPATIAYNLSASFLRALGDSRTPLVFLAVASVVNIGLDLFLIIVFGLGAAGAALATVISQASAGLLCTVYMGRHYPILRMEEGDWSFQGAVVSRLLSMGVPMGLQYSITAIGSIIMQSAVNSLGAVYVSATSTAHKINQLMISGNDGIGYAASTFTGQNHGAHRYDRVAEGVKACLIIGLVYWVITFAFIRIAGPYVSLIFLSAEEAASISGLVFLHCSMNWGFGFLVLLVDVFRGDMQGLSHSRLSMISGVMELIARALTGFLLVPVFGFAASCCANPIAWIFADLFLLPGFYMCLRSEIKQKSV